MPPERLESMRRAIARARDLGPIYTCEGRAFAGSARFDLSMSRRVLEHGRRA